MTGGLVAEQTSSPRLAELERAFPENPFLTTRFARALEALGGRALLLTAPPRDGQAPCGALGVLWTGRLRRVLEISSIPATGADDPFWIDLRRFARSRRVTDLRLYSFGTPGGVLPALAGEMHRRKRVEFVVELSAGNPDGAMPDAMRGVRKGRRAGLQLRRSTDPAATVELEKLFGSSMARRASRGEQVPSAGDPSRFAPYLSAGAGEIFFAARDEEIVSGALVLRAAKGGYYIHGGTSEGGRQCWASHFLMHAICCTLRDEGCSRFNLGGAGDDEQGLARFKSMFATRKVDLAEAEVDVAPAGLRLALTAFERVRSALMRSRPVS
jgi:hypothetical protein